MGPSRRSKEDRLAEVSRSRAGTLLFDGDATSSYPARLAGLAPVVRPARQRHAGRQARRRAPWL